MIRRAITGLIRDRLAAYPAVALIGPRQSVKTTLARGSGGEYFDLESLPDRIRLDAEWDTLAAGKELMVLDEAHAWPEAFPRLRGAIDRDDAVAALKSCPGRIAATSWKMFRSPNCAASASCSRPAHADESSRR